MAPCGSVFASLAVRLYHPRMPRRLSLSGIVAVLVAIAGCGEINRWIGMDPPPDPIGLIAVLPLDAVGAASEPTGPDEANPGKIVTAEIYGVLSETPQWRFVPDLTVTDHLTEISPLDDPGVRAFKLGKAVGADAVLFGSVSQYRERVGSEYGASQPAAVAITLKLLALGSKKVIWRGEFNEAQSSLSENLLNYWQFWRGGPKWFTAREYARLGVEKLLEDLEDSL